MTSDASDNKLQSGDDMRLISCLSVVGTARCGFESWIWV